MVDNLGSESRESPDVQPGAPLDLSVIIPSYNSERYVLRCLRSLCRQKTEARYEIIVVDSSTDQTPRLIAKNFPQVKLIRNPSRVQPGPARNLGARSAIAPLIAFVDADCEATPGWIAEILRAHGRGDGVIGGAVSLARGHSPAGAILFAIEFGEFTPTSRGYAIRSKWLPSCNLSVGRSLFLESGGFPEELDASEDVLFSRRMIARSVPVRFEPSALVYHHNQQTWSAALRHLRRLGYWSAVARTYAGVLGGSFLRFRGLIPLLVPYRAMMTLWRLYSRPGGHRLALRLTVAFPLLLYALMTWCAGFWQGASSVPSRRGIQGGSRRA